MSEPFFSMGAALRQMYLESEYDTPEEFLASLEVPERPHFAPINGIDNLEDRRYR